ncbi:thioredoxin family protein [Sphingobacterium paludis]|uniref:Thioredoxin-like protein n=1 Tax=Sphingobacterium paludis TaxID=1476465 RepID=A0A4R7CVB6_9SPHI|nr:thioredoxin family protein [Sphingobacterium paludis]TDS11772.1 thioredoxin-like protein [Sphingobacterium paludis]
MKKFLSYLWILMMVAVSTATLAQTPTEATVVLEKPYHPEADAQADIDSLLVIAKQEGKRVVIQAGGNWCIWCLRFNNYIQEEKEIAKLVADNFVYYHLNYSKENKNEAVFNRYAPEGGKLGYPFFIILDEQAKVLGIRDSGSLEAGKGYDKAKVMALFNAYKS